MKKKVDVEVEYLLPCFHLSALLIFQQFPGIGWQMCPSAVSQSDGVTFLYTGVQAGPLLWLPEPSYSICSSEEFKAFKPVSVFSCAGWGCSADCFIWDKISQHRALKKLQRVLPWWLWTTSRISRDQMYWTQPIPLASSLFLSPNSANTFTVTASSSFPPALS